MKHHFIAITIIASFMFSITSCSKNDNNPNNNNNNNNNNTTVTLPVTCDFTNLSLSTGATSFVSSGITFGGANAIIDGIWKDCIEPQDVAIEYNTSANNKGIGVWSPSFNCLIGNLASLPAMQKISVTLRNQSTNTKINVCDGNSVIAEVACSLDDTTFVLNLGGMKAAKLCIYSHEAVVKSVKIE